MKRYSARQWGLTAAAAAVAVAVAVLSFPYVYVTVNRTLDIWRPNAGTNVAGTSAPWNGTWVLVLALIAGAASAVALFVPTAARSQKKLFAASAFLYLVATVFALTDVFRSVDSGFAGLITQSKGIGPYSAFFMSVGGLIAAVMAARESTPGTTSPAAPPAPPAVG